MTWLVLLVMGVVLYLALKSSFGMAEAEGCDGCRGRVCPQHGPVRR